MFSERIKAIRWRLVGLYVTVFGLTLVGFSALLYSEFIRNHQLEFDRALYNHAVDVAQSIELDLFGELTLRRNILAEGEKAFPFALGRAYLQVVSIDGVIVARSSNLRQSGLRFGEVERRETLARRVFFEDVDLARLRPPGEDGRNYRQINYLIDKPGPMDFVLQIAVPTVLMDRESQALFLFFVTSIPLVLIVAAIAGLYFARRAMIPVQQAFESQEQFVANASHQLKTPLAILRGELDLTLSKDRSPDEVTEFLHSASQEVGHLERIVENLLILARIDAGTASLSIQPVRGDELMLESISRLESLAASKGVRLRPSLLGDSFEIQGDPDLLRSLLFNLIENAIKFTPPGGEVEIETREQPDSIVFRVKDTGPGLSQADVERIFERFYRGSADKRVPGTGLGLSIAHQITAIHGGMLSAKKRSDPADGKGSVFELTLKKRLTKPSKA